MEFKVYGHGGKPILVFPAQDGRFYDFENFNMVYSIEDLINSGKVQLFCCDSIDKESWSDILFFTGGYPDKMMAKFQKYDLVHELENFNGIMIGTSAGDMVQISEFHITKDSDYERYSYYIGLNIIKDFYKILFNFKHLNILISKIIGNN